MCEVWVCTWSVGSVPRQRGSAPRPAPAPVPAVIQRVGRGRGRGHRVAAPGVVTGRVALPRVLKYFLQSHVIFSPLCSHSTCTSSKPPLTGAAVSEASRAESAWYLSRYVDSRCRCRYIDIDIYLSISPPVGAAPEHGVRAVRAAGVGLGRHGVGRGEAGVAAGARVVRRVRRGGRGVVIRAAAGGIVSSHVIINVITAHLATLSSDTGLDIWL